MHRRLLAALAAATLLTAHAQGVNDPAQAATLRAQANIRSWDDGGALSNHVYRHISEIFPAAVVRRGAGPVRDLPLKPRAEVGDFIVDRSGGAAKSLRQYVASEPIDGLIIVHKGVIVFEAYPRMRPDDRHLAFSVTKAFVGTLAGLLEERKVLDLAQPVAKYLPELADSAWGPIRLRDVLDMASGMEGDEDSNEAYSNPAHKHFQLEIALGWQPRGEGGQPADVLSHLKSLKSLRPPGTRFAYNSHNSVVLGLVIERAANRRLADALADNIWSRIGAEGDALLLVNDRGVPNAAGGLAMTLRDLARFGMQFTKNRDRRGPVPEGLIRRLLKEGRPALVEPKGWMTHASYQFDQVSESGWLFKGGFGGQGLFVDVNRDVVVAMFGTNPTLDAPPVPMPVVKLVPALF
jgi:CubicO group peptidase (beta-lactamase class C family)